MLHREVVARTATFETVLEKHLGVISAKTRLNAFITVTADRARERARWADLELARNGGKIPASLPLLGVPVAIKDNLQWTGTQTTCASKMLRDYVSPFTATAVRRLEEAGAVIVGKTNLDEFAMGGSGEHSAFGPTLNPIDESRVPGGSSSGSAAAVAAGMVPVALGSDTGGSIRLPASFCGIVGLKPGYGRVSRYGLVAFASSLDQIGPMGATVSDVERVYRVIAGHDAMDSTSRSPSAPLPAGRTSGLRIGIPAEFFGDGLDPGVRASVDAALARLRDRGATLVPIALPNVHHSVACYYVIAVAEASSNLSRFDGVRFGSRTDAARSASSLEEFYCENRSLFGREVKRRILLGTFVLSSGYHDAYYRRACGVRELIRSDFSDAFSKVDLIASPVAPTPAFRLGEHAQSPIQMYLNDLYTIPANLAGLPALSVPVDPHPTGLPVGLQLMGPAGGEDLLLSVGSRLEVKA